MSGMGFSQTVPSYVPTNGLVGWWGFNGNAQDGSGNGNHGTINGATLTTDRFGVSNSAYNLPSLNNNISVSTASSPYNGNSLTISFWMQFPQQYNYSSIYMVKNGVSWSNGFSISIDQNDGAYGANNYQITFIVGTTPCGFITNQSELGIWSNIIGVYNGSEIKLYLNNILKTTVNYSSNISSPDGNLVFSDWDNPSTPVITNRNIDDIGIWNRALTPQEITNLNNSQLPTQTSLCLPTITTSSPSSVGVDTVVIGGDISNDGGSSIVLRGVCYSTSPNPNMGNQRTEDGSGTGSFNTVLRGLNPITIYYARCYAKNSNGVVVYGNEVSFTTSASLPGVRCPGTPTVTDIDGNVYNTVQIGGQCWTQSNLKTSRYRNGDTIATNLPNIEWSPSSSTSIGAYCFYNDQLINDSIYGKLYNYNAVVEARGLCPTGWHVPNDVEWTDLVLYLDPTSSTLNSTQSNFAGGFMKSTNTLPMVGGWSSPNNGATNMSGFSALPGDIRNGGYGGGLSMNGFWWSTTPSQHPYAWSRSLYYFYSHVYRTHAYKNIGMSVRCLKD